MFDKNRFRYYCARESKSMADIADMLKINPSTLSRKISGESDFARSEIQEIRQYLNLTPREAESIFFTTDLTQTQDLI